MVAVAWRSAPCAWHGVEVVFLSEYLTPNDLPLGTRVYQEK